MGKAISTKKVLKPPVTSSLIDSIVNRLVKKIDVEKIILFGSYITGTPTKDSDIDLLIIANIKEKGLKRYAIISELLEPREIPMDIIVKTPIEVKKRSQFFDPFFRKIYATGKVVYEKKA